MQLDKLNKIVSRKNKRLGRGIGSGKGKTAGRGYKGQKARGKVPAGFVGDILPLYKKLPLRRGWGNAKVSQKPVVIKIGALNVYKSGATVNLESLISQGLIKKSQFKKGVKILTGGELKIALNIELPVSASVKKSIEKAGGKVVV